MANEKTGADAVRVYLTGALVADGLQRDHDASDGGYRSSQRAGSMTWHRYRPIDGLLVEYVSGTNGPGLGTLETRGGDSVRWTPPRGTAGDWVTLADATAKVSGVTAGGLDGFLLVRRAGDAELRGAETVQLMDTVNNVFGMSNMALPSSGSLYQCRGLIVRNEGSTTVGSVRIMRLADSGIATDMAMLAETPVDGAIREADIWTPPSGTFLSTNGTWRTIATSLAPGAEMGLWLRRTVQRGVTAAAPYSLSAHVLMWYVGGTAYEEHLRGAMRVSDSALKRYLVFVGKGAAPNLKGTPDYTFDEADLPYTAANALDAGYDYDVRVVQQNAYGLRDVVGQQIVLRLGSVGEVKNPPPSGPWTVRVDSAGAGRIRVRAAYDPESDEYPAERWAIYVGLDAAPDPDVDTPVTVDMAGDELDWTGETAYLEDTPLQVLVRTQRNDGSVSAPDWVESENTETREKAAEWFAAARPVGAVSIGTEMGVYQKPAVIEKTVYVDQAKNVRWEVLAGQTRLWAGDVLVWNVKDGEGLFTTLAFTEGSVEYPQPETVRLGAWNVGAKRIHFAVRGTRLMSVDIVAGTVTCAALSEVLEVDETLSDSPVWGKWAATCLQVYSTREEQFRTALSLDLDAVLRLGVPWMQKATQEECL